jgi:hypothetical protein
MRIQPAGKSIGVGPASPTQPNPAASSAPQTGTDRVDLSALSQAAAGLGPHRIEEIQTSVNSGTYDVSVTELSRRIVDFYLIPVD